MWEIWKFQNTGLNNEKSNKSTRRGHLGGSVVEHLPLAQVVILGSRDRVPHQAPCGSLLLPLPVSLPLSVCLSWINKVFKKKMKERKALKDPSIKKEEATYQQTHAKQKAEWEVLGQGTTPAGSSGMGLILKIHWTHCCLPLQGFQGLLPVYDSSIWVYGGQDAPAIQGPAVRWC